VRIDAVDQTVRLSGWVHRRRDHGGLIFIDVRDVSGLLQIVFHPDQKELFAQAKELRPEFVIEVQGKVQRRPEGTENPNLPTGEVEVVSEALQVLNRAQTPPFEVEEETTASEEVRLAYRYIDLRRKKMKDNLILRHRVSQLVRTFLDQEGFIDVETPILTKSTPEGARDYLVPSRLSPGKFYALPQSPQLFKQLLMTGGLERYFQISRCFRDEDLRADRQPEFTQIDIEVSFPDEKMFFDLMNRLLKEIFEKGEMLIGKKLKVTFQTMTYQEAKEKYGADSPDLRFGIELQKITDLFKTCGFKVFETMANQGHHIVGLRIPTGGELPDKKIKDLKEFVRENGIQDLSYFRCENGALASPIAKHFEAGSLSSLQEKVGIQQGDLLLIVAHPNSHVAQSVVGRVRDRLKEKNYFPNLLEGKEEECAFVWVTDFPLFEKDEEGHLTSSHHPFTAPRKEDLSLLSSQEEADWLKIRSHAYDLVLNGIELGSGSLRIHDRKVQEDVFRILKLSREEQEARFGFLLKAFEYGAPPHGGIAFGLDRLLAMLVDLREGKFSDTEEATSIREVIAFPKTQKGTCPLTEAPSDIQKEKLRELGLQQKPS